MQFKTRLFIDGEFVDSESRSRIPVLNPHDNSLITEVAEAQKADIDRAVEAARKAFPAWARMAAMDRGRLLLKLADAIEANAEELAKLETLDTGHPLRDTRGLDVVRTAVTFRYFGGMADKFQGSVVPVEQGFLNYVLREPVGVVGQIVPWNFPLMFTSWKMGPALAAGQHGGDEARRADAAVDAAGRRAGQEVGFPKGVMNIVPGYGNLAGQYLAEHPGVDKIAFTGSTAVGRKIVQASAGNLKRVQLELGGKGANIVFDDADPAGGGQRLGVRHLPQPGPGLHRRLAADPAREDRRAVSRRSFLRSRSSIKLGNPMDADTEMGPLTSTQHRDRVLSYVKVAKEQGGEILLGGKPPERDELAKGCYVEPTVVRAKPTDRVSPGRGVRPVRDRHHLPRRRGGDRHRQRHASTAWAAGCGPPTCSAPTASRRPCAAAWCGSTATSGSTPGRRSAASGSRATGARWGSRRCTTTPRRSRCGSTSTRRSRLTTRARGR